MDDWMVFEFTLYKFHLIFVGLLYFKRGKEGHIFKGWFINMFREQLDLFLKLNNFLKLLQISRKLKKSEILTLAIFL